MNASTSKHNSAFEDDEIFDDSIFLANLDNSSFRQTKGPESNINSSLNTSALNVSALCCDEEISGYDKLTGQTWIYPTNYPVRDYQFNIINAAILKNTLVSLPTGLGKTFIAAVIMYNFYRWYPLGKIVFTAPTRPLVAQQIDACYNIVAIPPNDTIEMTGHMQVTTRKTHWQNKRVFFATPQVVYNDLKSGICPADMIRCLVIDEAHRARGNYAYCQIVASMDDLGLKTYRLLALSATPGSKVEDVINVVKSLHIAHLELRTENCIDVAPYNHSRKISTIIIQLGPELTQLRQHYVEILDQYARRLKQLNILPQNLGNLSKGRIVMLYKEYQNKERGSRHPQHNHIMKDFTLLIALYHGLELLVKHGSRVFLNFFDEHPEKSWIQSDDRLTALLERLRDDLGVNPLALDRSILPDGTIPEVPNNLTFGHPKFDKLKEIMMEHFHNAKMKKQDTKAIVFCEYRESVNLVHCLLLQCRPLIIPQMFVGQGSSGKDGKTVISQKQQLRVMRSFCEGLCNALVATCVAEEGLDVGSVDLILCFDISTRSPVRLVQRCGRTGRERGGQVFLLVTEGREHQTLLDCMRQRDGLNKKIQQSKEVQNNLYKMNPRMMPHGFKPLCQKMFITVKKDESKDKPSKKQPQNDKRLKGQKDLRSMLARPSTTNVSPAKRIKISLDDSLTVDDEFQSEVMRPEPMVVDEPIVINSQDTPMQEPNIAVPSPIKTKQARKKQKGIAKSPAKNYGDIRAIFNTATKSTKNYTKLINELGVNDSGVPTKLINLLVDLNLDNSNTAKTCYICQNICDCKMFKHSESKNKPVLLKFLNDPILPNLDLIDDINAETITMCNKSIVGTQDVESISRENSFISKEAEKLDKVNCSANFDLEFDFDALDEINSPETKIIDENKEIDADTNFDLGDIEDIFADSSPEEAIEKEMVLRKETKGEGTPKETEKALGFFGLDSIDDIFADSDDSVIQLSPEPKIDNNSNPEKNQEREKIQIHKDTVPNSAYPLSPSILSGKLETKRPRSPILCSQSKFQLSSKKAQPSSSTPNRSITKNLIDPKDNVIVIDDDDKSNIVDTTDKSMFTITQLVDMINKTGNKSIKECNNPITNHFQVISDEERSTSPILLTQADRKRSMNLSSSKNNISQSKSLIVLDSDSDSNEFNDTHIYDVYKEMSKLNASKIKTVNSSQCVKQIDNDDSKTKHVKKISNNDTSKRISFFEAVSNETNEVDSNKVANTSPIGIKRKFHDEDKDTITASPYFNKKPKLDNTNDKPMTLQQKVLTAISNKNKTEIKNNPVTLHFTVSQPNFSQKENENPHKNALNKSTENIRPFDSLQKYKKENKILSLRKKFNTIFKKSPPKSPVKTPLKTSAFENSDEEFLTCEDYFSPKKSTEFYQKTDSKTKRIAFDNSDDDFINGNSGASSQKESKNQRIKPTTNHKVRKKKRKNLSLLDMEAALSDSDSGDELTDSSAGSIAEFLCDHDVTHHEDIHAVYLKSVRSPVKKNGFKIPELPKQYNQNVFSQFVAEDAYEMDSFCVDSHIGLTQVNDESELEIAEILLKKKKRKKKHRSPSPSQNESPLVKRKYKKVNRLNSDSDDSS